MSTKIYIYIAAGILLPILLVSIIAIVLANQIPETPVHYHANFAVFENNNQVNFARAELMQLKPCRLDDDPSLHSKDENVHLHDMVGNVIHIHDSGITWRDVFNISLKYDIPRIAAENNLTDYYYLNGVQTDKSVLDRVVGKEDKLLVSLNRESLPKLVSDSPQLLTEMEQVGESAANYDKPGVTGESCSGTGKRSFPLRLKLRLIQIFSLK